MKVLGNVDFSEGAPSPTVGQVWESCFGTTRWDSDGVWQTLNSAAGLMLGLV